MTIWDWAISGTFTGILIALVLWSRKFVKDVSGFVLAVFFTVACGKAGIVVTDYVQGLIIMAGLFSMTSVCRHLDR